jgi:hypothetical protein
MQNEHINIVGCFVSLVEATLGFAAFPPEKKKLVEADVTYAVGRPRSLYQKK